MDYINELGLEDLDKSLRDARILVNAELSASRKRYSQSLLGDESQNMNVLQKMIEKLHDHSNLIQKQLNTIKSLRKNTLYCSVLIDCHALVEALNNYGHPIDSAEMIPVYADPDDPDNDTKSPIGYQLHIHYSRYTTNGDGYHVGYEDVTFVANCIDKKAFDLIGQMPFGLSSYVVNPKSFLIESQNLPKEELPTIDSHSSDCAIHSELPDDHDWDLCPFPDECNCGTNDLWNGYCPPDEDFFYSELDSVIHIIIESGSLPEAEFNPDEREWNIGIEANWRVGDTAYDDIPG